MLIPNPLGRPNSTFAIRMLLGRRRISFGSRPMCDPLVPLSTYRCINIPTLPPLRYTHTHATLIIMHVPTPTSLHKISRRRCRCRRRLSGAAVLLPLRPQHTNIIISLTALAYIGHYFATQSFGISLLVFA